MLIQNLESYLITPSVMQHQVKLLPGLTLMAQFIFTLPSVLSTADGLLLAVVIQVLVRDPHPRRPDHWNGQTADMNSCHR